MIAENIQNNINNSSGDHWGNPLDANQLCEKAQQVTMGVCKPMKMPEAGSLDSGQLLETSYQCKSRLNEINKKVSSLIKKCEGYMRKCNQACQNNDSPNICSKWRNKMKDFKEVRQQAHNASRNCTKVSESMCKKDENGDCVRNENEVSSSSFESTVKNLGVLASTQKEIKSYDPYDNSPGASNSYQRTLDNNKIAPQEEKTEYNPNYQQSEDVTQNYAFEPENDFNKKTIPFYDKTTSEEEKIKDPKIAKEKESPIKKSSIPGKRITDQRNNPKYNPQQNSNKKNTDPNNNLSFGNNNTNLGNGGGQFINSGQIDTSSNHDFGNYDGNLKGSVASVKKNNLDISPPKGRRVYPEDRSFKREQANESQTADSQRKEERPNKQAVTLSPAGISKSKGKSPKVAQKKKFKKNSQEQRVLVKMKNPGLFNSLANFFFGKKDKLNNPNRVGKKKKGSRTIASDLDSPAFLLAKMKKEYLAKYGQQGRGFASTNPGLTDKKTFIFNSICLSYHHFQTDNSIPSGQTTCPSAGSK